MDEINDLRKHMSALFRRAAVDEEFRRVCLEDGNDAYKIISGVSMPARYRMRFVEPEKELAADGGIRQVRLPLFLHKTWLG